MAARDASYASAVVVSVTPTQPSCFAGELFECTITFTNTHRAPLWDADRRTVSHGRLPADDRPTRRGLVGMQHSQWTRTLGLGRPSRRTHRPTFSSRSAQWDTNMLAGGGVQSGAPRAAGVGAALHAHPHARQKSVVAYQVEDLSQAFALEQNVPTGDAEEPSAVQPQPSPNPDAFVGTSARMDQALRESVSRWAGSLTQQSPRAHPTQSPLFPGHDALPTGYEKLLWTFAQFGGTMELDRSMVRHAEFDALRLRLARGELAPGTPVSPANTTGTPRMLGGGELGYDAEFEAGSIDFEGGVREDLRAAHVPAMATIAAFLFPAATAARAPHTARHMRSGSTLSDIQTRALMSRTLPTYSTPPTMLGIDVVLAPGESRSYTFALRLPADLPPSFHGSAVHFDYYLTIGTNRVDKSVFGSQQSRLLHIPIRVYNHVTSAGPASCFDLLNPIIALQSQAVVARAGSAEHSNDAEREKTAAVVSALLRGGEPPRREALDDAASCMDAINDLAQRAGKVSYDIAKEGHLAAVLTIARAKYRLGDAVHAIVRMNEPGATVRIVRVRRSRVPTDTAGRLARVARGDGGRPGAAAAGPCAARDAPSLCDAPRKHAGHAANERAAHDPEWRHARVCDERNPPPLVAPGVAAHAHEHRRRAQGSAACAPRRRERRVRRVRDVVPRRAVACRARRGPPVAPRDRRMLRADHGAAEPLQAQNNAHRAVCIVAREARPVPGV